MLEFLQSLPAAAKLQGVIQRRLQAERKEGRLAYSKYLNSAASPSLQIKINFLKNSTLIGDLTRIGRAVPHAPDP